MTAGLVVCALVTIWTLLTAMFGFRYCLGESPFRRQGWLFGSLMAGERAAANA
jgi:uncharacterized membrane protein